MLVEVHFMSVINVIALHGRGYAALKHWHGAARDSWFAHIAVEIPVAGASNEWLEPVADAEYNLLP